MSVEYKGDKCSLCGYYKCISALEFHHTNPNEKDFQISGKSISWDKIKNELGYTPDYDITKGLLSSSTAEGPILTSPPPKNPVAVATFGKLIL